MKLTRDDDRTIEIEKKLDDQAAAISELREEIQKALSTTVTEALEESDEEDDELDTHIGEPSPKQLSMINKLIGRESEASEWLVVPFMASNCNPDYSLRAWHRDTPIKLGLTAIGRPILLDHLWGDSRAAVGTIFDAKAVVDYEVSDEILDAGGFRELTEEIVKTEGYRWLYICAAIPRNSETADNIRNRIHSDCSTGSTLSSPYMICPTCSKEHKRDVSFYEKVKGIKGEEFLCNHLIPSKAMFDMIALYGEEDAEYNFAPYCILGGDRNEMIELSICNRGALPAASIIRG